MGPTLAATRPRPRKEPPHDPRGVRRHASAVAEAKDIQGWISCFNLDAVFIDIRWASPTARLMRSRFPSRTSGGAFPTGTVSICDVYVDGDIVVVQLALQGTQDGPLSLPQGVIPPTGNRMDAPCCDVFKLEEGRLQVFDCYPSGTVILSQLGGLGNLGAVLEPAETPAS